MKKKVKRQFVFTYVTITVASILLGTLLLGATISEAEVAKNKSGYISGPLLYILAIICICILIKKDFLKVIKQYVYDHPDITMQTLESDFNIAQVMGKRVWVGERWTFYMNFFSLPDVVEHEKIVWAYFRIEHWGKTSTIYIYAHDANKVLVKIPIAPRNAKKLLKVYSEKFGILIGYSEKYRQMYEKDFEQFLSLRYTNR